MRFTLIAALDFDGAIGAAGGIPWRAPADQARFKRLTMGHLVLFGRKTYATLPRPLEGRQLLVLTRSGKTPLPHGGELVFDVGQVVVGYARRAAEVYVGGGAEVYRRLLPLASRLELTIVHTTAVGADAFFPAVDLPAWTVAARVDRPADDKNPLLTYVTLDRRDATAPLETPLARAAEGFWKQALDTLVVPASCTT